MDDDQLDDQLDDQVDDQVDDQHEDQPEEDQDIQQLEVSDDGSSSDEEEAGKVTFPSEEHQFHEDEVYSICLHPSNPAIIVSGGGDNKAVVNTAGEAVELLAHTDSVISVSFSTCGGYLALGSMDSTITIWKTGQWDQPITRLEGPQKEITWIDWHPKGPILVAGSGEGSNWLWDVRTQTMMAALSGHQGASNCGHFSPNGRYLYSGGNDIRVWDLKQMANFTAPCIGSYGIDNSENVITCAAMRGDNNFMAAGMDNGTVITMSLSQGGLISNYSVFSDSIESIVFSPEMSWMALGCVSGGIKVIDFSTNSERCEVTTPGVVKLLWVNTHVYMGGLDGSIRMYQGSNLQQLEKFKSEKRKVLDFAVDAHKVVKAGEDSKIFTFSLSSED